MPAVWGPTTFRGTPPAVQNSARRRGNTLRIRKLLLDQMEYEEGGIVLKTPDHTLSRVYDAYILGGVDPEGYPIVNCHHGITIDVNLDGTVTLRVFRHDGEMEDGESCTIPEAYAWIAFTGVC